MMSMNTSLRPEQKSNKENLKKVMQNLRNTEDYAKYLNELKYKLASVKADLVYVMGEKGYQDKIVYRGSDDKILSRLDSVIYDHVHEKELESIAQFNIGRTVSQHNLDKDRLVKTWVDKARSYIKQDVSGELSRISNKLDQEGKRLRNDKRAREEAHARLFEEMKVDFQKTIEKFSNIFSEKDVNRAFQIVQDEMIVNMVLRA